MTLTGYHYEVKKKKKKDKSKIKLFFTIYYFFFLFSGVTYGTYMAGGREREKERNSREEEQ